MTEYEEFRRLIDPVAQTCDVPNEEVKDIYHQLSRVGVKGCQAGTTLRRIILLLNKDKK